MTKAQEDWLQEIRVIAQERERAWADLDKKLAAVSWQAKVAGVPVTEIAEYTGLTRDAVYKLWARHSAR